ncbi:MAG: hypothetical protein H7838_04295 [Magnetococcus sp. DMHC-8]
MPRTAKRSILSFHCFLIIMALWVGTPATGWARTHYHWVQLVAGQHKNGHWLPGVSVRAVVDQKDACPSLFAKPEMKKNDALFALTERPKRGAVARGDQFADIKMCEHTLPPDDKLLEKFTTAYLPGDNKAIPVRLPDLSGGGVPFSQLITSGCTGCRDAKEQYCSATAPADDKKTKHSALPWLYGDLMARAANEAGEDLPPLWIHLGDMRYSGQKEGVEDSWKQSKHKLGWKEELFEPTANLLTKSFVVMLRGNHEGCFVKGNDWDRSNWQDRGEAWFYFFGTGDQRCETVATQWHDVVPPFAMDALVHGSSATKPAKTARRVRLILLDTVRTGDGRDKSPDDTKKLYKHMFDTVAREFVHELPADQPAWLFEHIPAYELDTKKGEVDHNVVTKALHDSRLQADLAKVAMVNSAHLHQFSLIRTNAKPTQITVGDGGVALSGHPGSSCEVAGKEDLLGMQSIHFGYLHARLTVENTEVKARYEIPLFRPEPGTLQEARRIVCTGDSKNPLRPVCQKVPSQPACQHDKGEKD